ncbi:Beta-lactamase class C and other penicillin binding protein [Labilithrix luteola]|uniref:Beta-lactamase class C and other penicillin binding protein n=1 Tax=Labilithrix luteola TaxID=1391654 RepID=A0A0K1PMJ1_9BACT|nr:serine hydrolase domain-containing protein [Labilithrix luteola]AKU94631.1 Beta-lactamase class C and other penicillin binding protein [Labilithrix luteola]
MKLSRTLAAVPFRAVLLAFLGLSASSVAACQSSEPRAARAPEATSATTTATAPKNEASSPKEDGLAHALDAVVDNAIASQAIVGGVVVVVRDGHVVYHRAAGLADREAARPVQEDTVFRLASMTKPLVSATALALVDEGVLKLDDPVTKYLPTFKPKLANGKQPVITVRQLLTHTSGLDYGMEKATAAPFHRAHASNGIDRPGLSLEENLSRLNQVPLLFEPGTKWNYSMSTDVLGGVVAKASGLSLPEAVQKFVTGPLAMKATGFAPPTPSERLAIPYADGSPRPSRMNDGQVVPFYTSNITFAPSRLFDSRSYPSGGGGMIGTADDYVRFLETVRTGGGTILKPATAKAMIENQVGDVDVTAAGPAYGWSFGFAVQKKQDPSTPSNVGTFYWGGVYGNSFFVDPVAKLTVVVLTNTAVAGMAGPFPDAVKKAVYAAK